MRLDRIYQYLSIIDHTLILGMIYAILCIALELFRNGDALFVRVQHSQVLWPPQRARHVQNTQRFARDLPVSNDDVCIHLSILVGGWPTPLKNMKVSWDDYSQYMENYSKPPTSISIPILYIPYIYICIYLCIPIPIPWVPADLPVCWGVSVESRNQLLRFRNHLQDPYSAAFSSFGQQAKCVANQRLAV